MSVVLSVLDPASSTPAMTVLPPELLDEEAIGLVAAEGNSRQWVEQLVEAGFASEATRLLSVALPRKYALAWGCECLKAALVTMNGANREIDRAGVALCERWLSSPTEDHRRAALEFAERGKFDSAGAWIAAAAGWAEGSMAPPGIEPPVEPPPTLTGEAVAAALLTLALADPESPEERLRDFVLRALRSFGGLREGAVA